MSRLIRHISAMRWNLYANAPSLVSGPHRPSVLHAIVRVDRAPKTFACPSCGAMCKAGSRVCVTCRSNVPRTTRCDRNFARCGTAFAVVAGAGPMDTDTAEALLDRGELCGDCVAAIEVDIIAEAAS